jgi:hypothetical protein
MIRANMARFSGSGCLATIFAYLIFAEIGAVIVAPIGLMFL